MPGHEFGEGVLTRKAGDLCAAEDLVEHVAHLMEQGGLGWA
jgi:hypothetical protein